MAFYIALVKATVHDLIADEATLESTLLVFSSSTVEFFILDFPTEAIEYDFFLTGSAITRMAIFFAIMFSTVELLFAGVPAN